MERNIDMEMEMERYSREDENVDGVENQIGEAGEKWIRR